MSALNSLHWQHHRASQLMLGLINLIEAYRPGEDAYPIALQMAKWVSLLRGHLAFEDQWLYPSLMASRVGRAASTARRFKTEMGGLAERLEAFDRRWSSSAAIETSFGEFRRECWALFAAIDARIEREDEQLYPLAAALPAKELRRGA